MDEPFNVASRNPSQCKHCGYQAKVQYEKLYAQYQTIKKASGFGAERKAQKALDTANEYHETYRTEIAYYGGRKSPAVIYR